jgi:hypothetical protein
MATETEPSEPAEDEPAEATPAPAPARVVEKRPKRRRAPVPADESTEPDGAPEARASEDRPAFAARFPADPELDRLVALFEAGNYAAVREGAPRLARSTDRDDVRRAARLLRDRLDPDPLARMLIVVAALLLAFLALWYWTHSHTPPPNG